MKKVFFTPGPAQLYPSVEQHIQAALEEQIPSISHRSARFQEIFGEAVSNLRGLLGIPQDYALVFTASATEAWERIGQNCVEQQSFHLVNGVFSKRFADILAQLDIEVLRHEVASGKGFDPDTIDVPPGAELLALVANETSTGVATSPEVLASFAEKYPETLIAVDMVSIVPGVKYAFSSLDIAYFSVQKCFGLPAGLGVLILGPRAIARSAEIHAKGKSIGSYHAFHNLLKYAAKNQTPETPNVLGIYLLAKVSGDMLTQGAANIVAETSQKANLLYNRLSKHPKLSPSVAKEADRSPTALVFDVEGGSTELIEAVAAKGMVLGAGYGPAKTKQIRIANFPAVSLAQVETLIEAIEEF